MFLQRNKTAYTCINTFKTEKQEENMKKVAEVFKEKTGKDYQTAEIGRTKAIIKNEISVVLRNSCFKKRSMQKRKNGATSPVPSIWPGHFLAAWEWRYRKSASSRRECHS